MKVFSPFSNVLNNNNNQSLTLSMITAEYVADALYQSEYIAFNQVGSVFRFSLCF